MTEFWSSLGFFIFGGIIGAIIGFLLTRRAFQKQLKENQPVTEKMIRAMYMQMGRKPSEAQIRQIMKTMKQQ